MTIDLVLGTAGHIDHGKTSLVKALTGVDTDRLPEEKQRGITIELGFAELALGDYRLGIVDVPGHERFVRNMLAGATGVDLALLVVAADDSVKPQTIEHLEILRLLDLDAGVIALSRCDLAELDWIDLVEEEIRELVADTFLARAPIVRTSTVTGAGLDELRAALGSAAAQAARSTRRRQGGPFRLAIDRAFTIAGHGTVVTGSVLSGQAHLGDELVIEPDELPVRVRSLQNHGRQVEEIGRGQRAAINIAGVHHDQLRRGHELATPGHLVASRRLSIRLNLLPSAPRPLKHRARVRLHVGTAELMAGISLLDRDQLDPGDSALVQAFLSRPAVATWRQPLVVRSESPVETIGGGHVLDPNAPKLRRRQQDGLNRLEQLLSDDPSVRASAALYFAGVRPWQPQDLARTAGVDDIDEVCRALVERGELVEIAASPMRTIRVHRDVLDELSCRVEKALADMHRQQPLRATLDRSSLLSRFDYVRSSPLMGVVLQRMADDERITTTDRGVALAGHGPQLSAGQRELVEQIVRSYVQSGYQPPSVDQIKAQVSHHRSAVPELIALAAAEGRLVELSAGLYLDADAERRMRETLTERLSGSQGLTLSEIREILATTRKYAVPLCEYLDRIGFTTRQGDVRVLG
ncbi:MAG: selenocysteine-specific translation elongation factor [Candidatus Nealsonbacteria bacterium]|nr:selenocysteine-specific translation elongation factor [Candidatus Nealsonbacteria bacterium]